LISRDGYHLAGRRGPQYPYSGHFGQLRRILEQAHPDRVGAQAQIALQYCHRNWPVVPSIHVVRIVQGNIKPLWMAFK
jgi:hypothetical protein